MAENKTVTKTYPPLVKKIGQEAGYVIHHAPTENNPLGQSGLHTLILDILDIVEMAPDPATACRDLDTYFRNGEI